MPTQDFWRLEEEMANHTPKAWEDGGPSWTPQAIGMKASASKGHSQNGPLAESEGVIRVFYRVGPVRVSSPQLEAPRLVQHLLSTCPGP